MMATLLPMKLNFYRQIKILDNEGDLSPDTSGFLFGEFVETIGFSRTLAEGDN